STGTKAGVAVLACNCSQSAGVRTTAPAWVDNNRSDKRGLDRKLTSADWADVNEPRPRTRSCAAASGLGKVYTRPAVLAAFSSDGKSGACSGDSKTGMQLNHRALAAPGR